MRVLVPDRRVSPGEDATFLQGGDSIICLFLIDDAVQQHLWTLGMQPSFANEAQSRRCTVLLEPPNHPLINGTVSEWCVAISGVCCFDPEKGDVFLRLAPEEVASRLECISIGLVQTFLLDVDALLDLPLVGILRVVCYAASEVTFLDQAEVVSSGLKLKERVDDVLIIGTSLGESTETMFGVGSVLKQNSQHHLFQEGQKEVLYARAVHPCLLPKASLAFSRPHFRYSSCAVRTASNTSGALTIVLIEARLKFKLGYFIDPSNQSPQHTTA